MTWQGVASSRRKKFAICVKSAFSCAEFNRSVSLRPLLGWEVLSQKASAAGTPIAPFDPAGGEGYDVRKPPHHDCPECFGEGVAIPFPKDTRHLSEGARWLFAGVKVTKDGIEIKMHDQMAALLNIAKHLGMFVTKVEHSGKNGAIPITIVG